ncbi:MAG TPA: PIG-L family deacetylase [Vicinamibacterales bacterium]|nr:PIG-L family deacetylase [Vicinamibacterales bacterium]
MKIAHAVVLVLLASFAVAQDPLRSAAPLDVLIVAPHPDDETIGCAGVTLHAIARGERVGIVVLTQGDAHVKLTAVVAQKPAEDLGPDDFIRAGVLRQGHTLRAAASMGVAEADVVFLGYPDGGLGKMYRDAGDTHYRQPLTTKQATYAGARRDYHSAQHGRPAPYTRASVLADLEAILRERRPRAVYVTHESDKHADHAAAFWFVRDALQAAQPSALLFAFVVHGEPLKRRPDLRVALAPRQIEAKRQALLMHQAGVSPVHDYLAKQFASPEEIFWEFPLAAKP